VSARMLVKNENQRQSYTSNVFILKDYYAEDCEAHEKASGSL
jgi:hypothetical protein